MPLPSGFGGSLCGRELRLELWMARPAPHDPVDIGFLQKEAKRYRSEAREAATERERNYFLVMSSLSETMAANEKMRAWLERSIEELTSKDWQGVISKRQEATPLPESD
jgi:hypothetical protein